MAWSFRVGSLFGIPLRIHVTFVLLLLLVLFSQGDRAGVGGVGGALFILALFACVVIHELAHSLVARHYGIGVRGITLLPIGGVAMMERMPDDPRQELNMAVAGPLTSLGLGVVLGLLVTLTEGWPALVNPAHMDQGHFWVRLAWLNLMLAGFNILPAFPMDGGRVLRGLLAMHMDYTLATHRAALTGQALAILMGFAGFWLGDWWLVAIAVFVYMGAASEDHEVRFRRALAGVRVAQAMVNDFRSMNKEETLQEAFAHASTSYQHDFPVLEEGELVGLLTRQALIQGMHELGGEATVGQVMRGDVCQLNPTDSLADAYRSLGAFGCPIAAVKQDGQLLGLLTPDSVAQYVTSAVRLRSGR